MSVLRVATRGSPLARVQADRVMELLGVPAEPYVVTTSGDRRLDVPIWSLGGKGTFVAEVQAALLDGRADIAVHSAKDLPSATPDGLVLAAVPERLDPRDALVGCSLATLRTAARVGTGSNRRRVQLIAQRPDLTFVAIRGNLETRLRRADVDAVVVAAAALYRLGLLHRAAEILSPAVMLPQVGQGALAVECRSDDHATRSLLASIDDPSARRPVEAERSFLRRLGGGCDLPGAAFAVALPDGELRIEALLASLDGHVVLRTQLSGPDPERLGGAIADRLLDELGGRALWRAG